VGSKKRETAAVPRMTDQKQGLVSGKIGQKIENEVVKKLKRGQGRFGGQLVVP